MLVDSSLRSLGLVTNVPAVTTAHEFIFKQDFVEGTAFLRIAGKIDLVENIIRNSDAL